MLRPMLRRNAHMRLLCMALLALVLSQGATAGPVRPMSALRGLLRRAVAEHARHVTIPPGVYRGGPPPGDPVVLTLQNAENLKIIARGVEMVCTKRTRAILFNSCQNVELDGLTIDYDPLTFTQGRVTAIAPDANSVDITLDAGYPRLPFERIMLVDPRTRFEAARMPFFWGSKSAMVGPDVVRVTLPGIGKSARGGMLATLSDGNEPGGVCHGVTIEHCRGGMVLDGLTVYCAPGMGIVEAQGTGGTQMRHVRIVPGPPPPGATEPRLLTTSWDGILNDTLGHGDDVEDCTIRNCGDDSWSDQSSPLLVVKAGGASLVLAGDVPLTPGDHLRRSLTDAPFTIRQVQTVPLAQAGLPPDTMGRLDHPAQYSLWAIRHDVVRLVTVDRDAALAVGASVYAPEHQGNGFVFRHNTLHSSGRVLIKASNGLIEGNTIIGGHNIAVTPEVPTGGAFGIQHLMFRNNRIVGADATNEMPWAAQAGALSIAAADPASSRPSPAPAGSYRDITITGNTFEGVSAVNIWLAGVRGAKITGNRFLHPDNEPLSWSGISYGVDNADVILLRNCDQVLLSENQVLQPGRYEKAVLSTDASDARISVVNPHRGRSLKP